MNDVSTPNMSLLEKALNVISERHKLVVSNMANVDTPGYQTKDIDFRSELQREVTNGSTTFMPVVQSVQGLMQRPDGNNVSLDREGLMLAETQMQYSLGIELMRHEFQNLMYAINEGNKSA
jgi:flagellar basal-body rod protein FlgB